MGKEHIPTMSEIQEKWRKEARAILILELAKSDVELKPLSISAWLLRRGMRGRRFPKTDDEGTYVSILYPPNGRIGREHLDPLIAEAVALRRKLRMSKVRTAKKTVGSPVVEKIKLR